jgi:peptidoglycan-associated lipoprotein
MKHSLVVAAVALFALACAGPQGPTRPRGPAGITGMTGTPGPTGPAAPPGPAESATGWISLRDILFDFDTADIRPSELSKISDIATYLNQNPSLRVGIDGSTDLLRGTNRYNVALSERRVANVRDALIRTGVSADRIETGRFGVERVECNESTEPCAQRDGRVEVMGRRGE